MSENESATSSGKDLSLARLRQYRDWSERRDLLVCDAKQFGATYAEIMAASGLAKGTVNSILDRAGLTGDQTRHQESTMTTSTAAVIGIRARFFAHHPHFVDIKPMGGSSYNYTFRQFSGDEPEPERPDHPAYVPVEDRTTEYEAQGQEWSERCTEMDVAHKLWEQARYRRQITPLVEAAIKARPPVDQALSTMQQAWEALDNALVWPVAVKQLLDAQDRARAALAQWVDTYAYPLAVAEGTQSYYIRENIANWGAIADELNDGRIGWEIGDYYAGDRHVGAGYSDSPLDDLERTIEQQRAQLAEIAKYSKPEPTA